MASHCSPQCSASICSSCRELQALEDEVRAAEDALHAAQAVLSDAKRARAVHLESKNRRTSAVTKLPPEIVRSIIDLYMLFQEHELDPSEYFASPSYERPRWFRAVRRGAPLLFGAISRQWRSVAWSYPDLWETIVVPLYCRGHEHGPQMVSEWLQRSQNRPLSIQINNAVLNDADRTSAKKARVQENAKQIIQVLNQHASQWRTLDFSETAIHASKDLDDGTCLDTSQLQHLALQWHWESERPDDMEPLLRMSKRVHRPTSLNLLAFIPPSKICIDWASLTHFYAEAMSREELFKFLELTAAQLSHLSMRGINAYDLGDAQWTRDTPLHLPELVSLSMHQYHTEPGNARHFLESITAPALQSFSYDGADSELDLPQFQLLDFIAVSNCRITELEILNCGLDDEALESLLRSMPTVERLKIRLDFNDSQYFLQCLSAERLDSEVNMPFLPALRLLDIDSYRPRPSWSAFFEMYAAPEPGDVPARAKMNVKYRVRYQSLYGHHGYLDRDSLMAPYDVARLVRLWKSFGVICTFKMADDGSAGGRLTRSEDEMDFWAESLSTASLLYSHDAVDQALRDDVKLYSRLEI